MFWEVPQDCPNTPEKGCQFKVVYFITSSSTLYQHHRFHNIAIGFTTSSALQLFHRHNAVVEESCDCSSIFHQRYEIVWHKKNSQMHHRHYQLIWATIKTWYKKIVNPKPCKNNETAAAPFLARGLSLTASILRVWLRLMFP